METLPLLLFPTARQAKLKSPPFPGSKPRLPSRGRQVERVEPKLVKFQKDFFADHAVLKSTLTGYEPEFVLVIETADRLDKFKEAIDKTEGLEWLAEWDDDIDADDDFYHLPTIGVDFFKGKVLGVNNRAESSEIQKLMSDQGYLGLKNIFLDRNLSDLKLPQHLASNRSAIEQAIVKAKRKPLAGRVYLSMSSQKGLEELTSLWTKWKKTGDLPYGKGKWKEVFGQITDIRRWGIQEQLIETGVIDEWKKSLEQDYTAPVNFQIELFYRNSKQNRKENESTLLQIISQLGGSIISNFIDIPEIRFHAVKAELPASGVSEILRDIENESSDLAFLLFSGIMYYRPTGQSFTSSSTKSFDAHLSPPTDPVSGDPVVAILDGVPFSEHSWLKGRLLLDDADNLESEYQPGERKHGTAMASLVLHGELDKNETPLNKPVYFRPIMQPNVSGGWSSDFFEEHIPQDVFLEDRIWRAVRRMFEGEGTTPPQAPSVRVINLSIGDRAHQFEFSLSPCARLLDWLSWKYNVLFCVSIGNHKTSLDLGLTETEFKNTKEQDRIGITLREMNRQVLTRRLLSPSESLNSISVGSLHCDESSIITLPHHVDVLPNPNMPSPLNSVGYGFRRSIKPEILFPGGKQLYKLPLLPSSTSFEWSPTFKGPGQRVATEGSTPGSVNETIYTKGTSNATALATRAAARINEVIEDIMAQNTGKLPETHIPVMIKTLLTHGAIKGETMEELENYLRPLAPPRKAKEFICKFTGYGAVDIERVLYCTEQRATIVGTGTIGQKSIHEYRLPLPPSLANETEWRRLIITLGWFTPINPSHRYLRQAALSFEPPKKNEPLLLERSELDPNQVKRGTLQHEILQSEKVSDYQDGDFLVIPVQCRADATDSLDDHINYALAVTLEVKEGQNIPIYQEIQEKIRPRPPILINRGK